MARRPGSQWTNSSFSGGGAQKSNPPRILVADEKHATRYFAATTEEELHASALKLLAERIDSENGSGYIQDPGTLEEWGCHPEWDLSDDQIRILPTEQLRKTALSHRREFKLEQQDWQKFKEDFDNAQKAVKEKNGKLAWEVLRNRSDHEYEKVELEYLE